VPASALRASVLRGTAIRGLAGTFVLAGLPAAAHAEGGMPQFDVTSFDSQIFWLVISFGLLYFLMSTLVLPRIGNTIEAREAKIQGDLAAAQQANDAARIASVAHDKALAEARNTVHATIHAATEAAAAETTARINSVAHSLGVNVAAAERRIEAQREQSLDALASLATEISTSILGKLVGTADSALVTAKVAGAIEDARKRVK
jgi:F-type H+-transporting ATPase subunit b